MTVSAYLFAAFLSARGAKFARLMREPKESMFWRLTAMLLVLLGFNEVLDLQTLLTAFGREHAKANGWYGDHRAVQYVFVLSLGAAVAIALATVLWLTKGMNSAVRLAIAGLSSIALFVLLRAATFHHLADVLGSETLAHNWDSVPEMVGIVAVGVAAGLYGRKRNPES